MMNPDSIREECATKGSAEPYRITRLWIGFLTITLLLNLACSHASNDAGAGNWNVDGLNGELHLSGSLLSAPCQLDPESQEQEISLGRTIISSLKHPGDVSVPVTVHVVLHDCPGGSHYQEDRQRMRSALFLSALGAVRMTVSGNADPVDDRFFQIAGGASGVSLRLETPDGELMSPHISVRPLPLSPGRNDVGLKAQLRRNEGYLRAGEWYSVVQIGLEYE